MTTAVRALALFSLAAALGCGSYIDTPAGESVDITGKVMVGNSKASLNGLQVVLQPTGGAGQQVFFALKADGTFSGKANAGKYTYYLQAAGNNEAALDKFPKEARVGSMDRQVDVKAGGGLLELKL